MKVILGTFAVSVILPVTAFAQVASGGAPAGSSVGSAAAGARSAGVAGSGALSPSGSLAGQPPVTSPTPVAPGTVGTVRPPGSTFGTPVAPLNPGGIQAQPPGTVGRTFDRPTIGGPTVNTLPTPALDTSATPTGAGGFPAPTTFPPGPVGVNNTVGANFGGGITNAFPREPVAVNLPPGARLTTNVVGIREVIVPPPAIAGTNIGRPPTLQTGTNRSVVPRTVPAVPPQAPTVSRGPILDSRTQQ